MFVDEVSVILKAGHGGDGCTSFRREKYVPFGGPDGGNGGRGSNIVFKTNAGLRTLIDFKYNKTIIGKKGENGRGKNQHGRKAEDIICLVPLGTVVTDVDTSLVIADLTGIDDEVVVAYGGRGGRGNKAFATNSNNAPEISEYGEEGEVRKIKLELKLLADVGLVGMPSVGKSTFLSVVSKAKPKIAAYHFTTLIPNLGVVETKDKRSFVIADLPGLIKGASLGQGLGDEFLKHIERTRIIAHIVDMGASEGRDPYEDYQTILEELRSYNPKLLEKKQIIIANKMDLENAQKNLEEFKKKIDLDIYEVSSINSSGIDLVLLKLADILDATYKVELYKEEEFLDHVLYKFKAEKPFYITRDQDGVYIIKGDGIEKLFKLTKFDSQDSILRFAKKLSKMGIDDELVKMGAKNDDIVKILDYSFEFKHE